MAHVALATPDLASAIAFYRDVLGMRLVGEEELPDMSVRVAFLEARGGGAEHAAATIELLEPTRADSPVARFLARRGPGLHHISFEVEDLAATLALLKARGVRLIDETPRRGAQGHLVAFLHPEAAGGVLVELTQAPG